MSSTRISCRSTRRSSRSDPGPITTFTPEDIGENLVGSYLRYVEGCDLVVHNTFLAEKQGEIDVLGITLQPERQVIFAEVTTHILGMSYGDHDKTVRKLRDKIKRATDFADETFPDEPKRYEIWSPVVHEGKLTAALEELAREYSEVDLDVLFVVNQLYAERVQALIDHARRNSKATSDPAYRLLQVLTRVRGTVRF